VLVSRTDAARGRADFPFAAARLRQQIKVAVVREDDVRLVAHDDPTSDVDAGGRQLVHFREQRLQIDDNAVADHAGDAGMQNAGRYQPQYELDSVHVYRVAGVVTALRACDDGKMRRQQIDDLPFAFVAPLRTENRKVHTRNRFYFVL